MSNDLIKVYKYNSNNIYVYTYRIYVYKISS